MSPTLAKSKSRAAKARKPAQRRKFWITKPNREMDRAGDWLVKNLKAVREQAQVRANSR